MDSGHQKERQSGLRIGKQEAAVIKSNFACGPPIDVEALAESLKPHLSNWQLLEADELVASYKRSLNAHPDRFSKE